MKSIFIYIIRKLWKTKIEKRENYIQDNWTDLEKFYLKKKEADNGKHWGKEMVIRYEKQCFTKSWDKKRRRNILTSGEENVYEISATVKAR